MCNQSRGRLLPFVLGISALGACGPEPTSLSTQALATTCVSSTQDRKFGLELPAKQATSWATGVTKWQDGISNVDDGDWVAFAGVDFGNGSAAKVLEADIATPYAGNNVEIRLDCLEGEKVADLATCQTEDTPTWQSYEKQYVELSRNVTGIHDVFVRFNGARNAANRTNGWGFGIGNFRLFAFRAGVPTGFQGGRCAVPRATQTSLTPSAANLDKDTPLTLTVAVSSALGAPSGDATIRMDGKDVAVVPVQNGAAQWVARNLPVGARVFSASFNGADGFASSTSADVVVRVVARPELTYSYSFSAEEGGLPDLRPLVRAFGSLYGIGLNGAFAVDLNGGVAMLPPSKAYFGNSQNYPMDLVLAGDGNLYGVSQTGSQFIPDKVFRMSRTGLVEPILSFDVDPSLGDMASQLAAIDGALYVTVRDSNNTGYGLIVRVNYSGTYKVIHVFDGVNGGSPFSRLVQGTDGMLYGTGNPTSLGGGVVFRMSLDGSNYQVLHRFPNDGGTFPTELVEHSPGVFFGSTMAAQQAQFPYGSVFRITDVGQYSVVHEFDSSSLYDPAMALVVGPGGNLFGTALAGGIADNGGIFRITPQGKKTDLFSFSGHDGSRPNAPLLRVGSQFWGTTSNGGATNNGTVFRFDPN